MVENQEILAFDEETERRLAEIYGTPDMVARRRAVLESVNPRHGEHGLDIGSSTGLLACELADAVGSNGRITAIDTNPGMLAMTERCAETSGFIDRVSIYPGNAMSLPLYDETQDFVIAAQVLEYVSDPAKAVNEVHRVLRPGGRFVVIDSDWDTLIVNCGEVDLTGRIMSAGDGHVLHRTLPRRLPGLLRAAGFAVDEVRTLPVLNISHDPTAYDYRVVELMATFARGRGDVTDADVDAWLQGIADEHESGCYFFCLTQFLFRASKPKAAAND
jgi:arsenite methyltransferase